MQKSYKYRALCKSCGAWFSPNHQVELEDNAQDADLHNTLRKQGYARMLCACTNRRCQKPMNDYRVEEMRLVRLGD